MPNAPGASKHMTSLQTGGTTMQVEAASTSDSDSDALSSDFFADDANDTASEDEKLPAGTLVR